MIHEKRSTTTTAESTSGAISETASPAETAGWGSHEVTLTVRLVVRSKLEHYTREEAAAFAVVLASELNRWAPHAEVLEADAQPAHESHGARRTGGT